MSHISNGRTSNVQRHLATAAGVTSFVLGAVSLGIQESRSAILAMPILNIVCTMNYSARKEKFLYGNINNTDTRRFIQSSLLLAFACIYGWQVCCTGFTYFITMRAYVVFFRLKLGLDGLNYL